MTAPALPEVPAATTAAGPRLDHEQHTPSRACYLRGCRLPECREADYQYMSRIRLDHHRGQRRRTDASQTRHHIELLLAAGWTQAQIRRATGLAHRVVGSVLAGQREVANDTARAILAIPLSEPPSDTRDVDATGTVRRVRALIAIGWPVAQLAPRFGLYETALGRIARGELPHVRATTAGAVAVAYRHLSRTPGRSQRARTHAAQRGWHGPAAWDEHTIDNPDARPDADLPEPELTRNELAELRRQEIEHLAGFGIRPEEIAARLGMGFTTVTDILREYRRAAV
ncbi:hypothetical protein [Streptomyces sp. NPDC088812]|uniref:hypothetical protein n=1 Tax=Streptomyces sp. NPDC088812 TaxID=3365905 RepID=UPI00382545DB